LTAIYGAILAQYLLRSNAKSDLNPEEVAVLS